MATTAKNMKGFYKQTKSNITGGISKSKPSSSSRKVSPATRASDATQPKALIDVNDYDKNEEMLRQFDMDMAYGPCMGMTRLGRWERAMRLGMNPPNEIEKVLKTEKVKQDCLWQGRV
ncbi:hypothetical protein AALP_AA1G103800 [Arabis alpina]|uniref:DNA polymerase delta subunit 4 n=1 Tax=Arabis alpina TaxID=50452 RepID=A0A087HMC9_ARAAL|nr:hypothetical protein AALP_AA1G103800 [Arabis alpina]